MSISAHNKRKLSLPIVVAGGVSALVLALGMSPTFSAFSASIANNTNTAGTGTLVMEEKNSAGTVTCLSTDGAGVSTNAATCATINKYGGDLGLVPGEAKTTTVNIRNAGTLTAAAFTLTPGACTQSLNGTTNGTAIDACTKTNILVKSGSTTIFTGTAAAFAAAGPIDLLAKLAVASIPAGVTVPVTFTVTPDATMGNTYQGLKISQPMTWAYAA